MKRRTLLFLCMGLTLSACQTPSEPVSVTGKYLLLSVNGSALPFTYPNGVSVKREVINLQGDGGFTDEIEHVDGKITTHNGAYVNYTGTVNMAYPSLGAYYLAKVEGSTLSRTVGSYNEVYGRQ